MEFKKKKNERRSTIVTLKLFDGEKDRNGRELNRESMLDIITGVDFSKISIPVFVYKELVTEPGRRGTIIVGHIMGFDPKMEAFDVVVYSNSIPIVEGFEDPIICPRMFIDNETGTVKTILGFDAAPKTYFFNEKEE